MRKTKRIFKKKRRKIDPFVLIVQLKTVSTLVQVEIIKSQPGSNKDNKISSIVSAIENLAYSMKQASKQAMILRFKTTGRYVR